MGGASQRALCGVRGLRVATVAGRGDRQDAAEKKLKDRGLTLGTVTPAQSCDDLGRVVDQDPMKDVEVRSESAVNVTVRSTGPKPAMVPAISRGETQGVVVARIRAAGLSVSQKQNRRATFDFGPDTVVDVQPKPGTPLAPGCEVTLTVATTPQVSVPSYVGKTLADAKGFGTTLGNAFSGVAFMIGTATAADGTVVSGDEKSWRVVSQTPTAGTRVSTKSQQVDVVVERIESNASRPAPRPGAAIRVPDQPVIK